MYFNNKTTLNCVINICILEKRDIIITTIPLEWYK